MLKARVDNNIYIYKLRGGVNSKGLTLARIRMTLSYYWHLDPDENH